MPLPFIIAGFFITGSLLSAKRLAISAIAVDRYKNSRGYRSGEGPLTPREGEYGMLITEDSKSQLGVFIAEAANKFPELVQFKGKLLEMTCSEARDLREITSPALAIMQKIIASRSEIAGFLEKREKLLAEESSNERNQLVVQYTIGINSVDAMLEEFQADLTLAMRPISQWLKRFPERRIKNPPAAVLPMLTNAN